MAARSAAQDFRSRMLIRGHRALLTVSRGRLGSRVGSMPVVDLHTIGRTSGRRRRE